MEVDEEIKFKIKNEWRHIDRTYPAKRKYYSIEYIQRLGEEDNANPIAMNAS